MSSSLFVPLLHVFSSSSHNYVFRNKLVTVAYFTNCIHLYHFICYVNQRVTTAAGDVVKCSLDRTPLVIAGCFMYVRDENLMPGPYPDSEPELLTEEAQNEAEDDAAVARVTMCAVCHCSYGDRPVRFLANCNCMYHIDCFNTEFRNANPLRCVRCSKPFRLGNYKDHHLHPWLLNQ
ncbi:hypothetical protein ACP275_08G132700 [Erythranthe tilingii]